jgi:hypothetical protein
VLCSGLVFAACGEGENNGSNGQVPGDNTQQGLENNIEHTHNWDDGTITTPATYYSKGVRTFKCTDDQTHTKTEEIAMTTATVADFLSARNNTVNGTQFEYDYNLAITTKVATLDGPSARTNGNIKYNSTTSNKYLRTDNNSGALLSDGTVYSSLQGTNLETFKVDSVGGLYDHQSESVAANFKYESSSYAKLLFTADTSKITSLTKTTGNYLKYKVTLPTNAGIISTGLSVLNSPFVQRFLSVPDSSGTVNMYITFDGKNGNIQKYEYDFEITVTAIKINFHYDLTFTKVGSGVTVSPPSFSGCDLTTGAINSTLSTIKSELDEYRAGDTINRVSSHTYDVKTAVDYAWNSLAVDSRSQGRTLRKIDAGTVYFWNRLEYDSDYKNADQYKTDGIVDYERYRAKLSNGDVYDREDGLFSNPTTQVTPYANESIDNYYMLLGNDFFTTSNVSMIKTTTSGTKTTYSLGLTKAGVLSLLDFADESIRMDVVGTNEHKIFNILSNSLELNSLKFNIEVTSGKLTKIEIVLKGSYVDSVVKDENNQNKTPSFTLDMTITPNYTETTYDIPVKDKDIDLSNS